MRSAVVCELTVRQKTEQQSTASNRVSIIQKMSIESILDIQYQYLDIVDNTAAVKVNNYLLPL